jgi:hypothetical protein
MSRFRHSAVRRYRLAESSLCRRAARRARFRTFNTVMGFHSAQPVLMRRDEIWWVRLPDPRTPGLSYRNSVFGRWDSGYRRRSSQRPRTFRPSPIWAPQHFKSSVLGGAWRSGAAGGNAGTVASVVEDQRRPRYSTSCIARLRARYDE